MRDLAAAVTVGAGVGLSVYAALKAGRFSAALVNRHFEAQATDAELDAEEEAQLAAMEGSSGLCSMSHLSLPPPAMPVKGRMLLPPAAALIGIPKFPVLILYSGNSSGTAAAFAHALQQGLQKSGCAGCVVVDPDSGLPWEAPPPRIAAELLCGPVRRAVIAICHTTASDCCDALAALETAAVRGGGCFLDPGYVGEGDGSSSLSLCSLEDNCGGTLPAAVAVFGARSTDFSDQQGGCFATRTAAALDRLGCSPLVPTRLATGDSSSVGAAFTAWQGAVVSALRDSSPGLFDRV